MSTNQSIYQQPPPAYTNTPTNNKMDNYTGGIGVNEKKMPSPSVPPSNNVSPGFSRNRRLNVGSNYNSPITNIEYGSRGYGIKTGRQNYPNPAFTGTTQAPPIPSVPPPYKPNLKEEEIQALEKIEEMKTKAETKSADEVSNSATRKYAIIFAAVVLVIAGVVLLWVFYISKSRSGKDVLTSSDAGANVANSSGEWGQSSGKSADSSK